MHLAEHFPRLESLTVTVDDPEIQRIQHTSEALIIGLEKVILPIPTNDLKLINVNKSNDGITTVKFVVTASETPEITHLGSSMGLPTTTEYRWSTKDLLNKTPASKNGTNQFRFACVGCGQTIVESIDKKFYDLPSEYWAEMMEFWHCHKPHEGLQSLKERAYFQGEIRPAKDETVLGNYYLHFEGLKDVALGLLFVEDDQVFCKCGHELGQYIEKSSTFGKEMYFKVSKWNVTLHYMKKLETIVETFSPHLFIYNLIIDKISALAIRKFQIRDLKLWVVNVGLNVSTEKGVYRNCLKILYTREREKVETEVGNADPKSTSQADSSEPHDIKISKDIDTESERLHVPDSVFYATLKLIQDISQTIPQTKISIGETADLASPYIVSYLPAE